MRKKNASDNNTDNNRLIKLPVINKYILKNMSNNDANQVLRSLKGCARVEGSGLNTVHGRADSEEGYSPQ